MQSNRTNRPRIAVKTTISEDLSRKDDPKVAKLQYLQKKNEKLNRLHIRSDIALPSRSQQRNHGLNQDMGHESLLSTGLIQSRQFGINKQQVGNQYATRPQIPRIPQDLPPALQENLAQKTPEQVNAPGAMLTGVNIQGPMQRPQNAQVQRHINIALKNQGPFTGWRAEVIIPDRAGKVMQMITSLRLLQPRIEIQNALQAALQFEEKSFLEANQRDDYEKECASKLRSIKETGLRQQAVYNQGGLMQHGGANGGMPDIVYPN